MALVASKKMVILSIVKKNNDRGPIYFKNDRSYKLIQIGSANNSQESLAYYSDFYGQMVFRFGFPYGGLGWVKEKNEPISMIFYNYGNQNFSAVMLWDTRIEQKPVWPDLKTGRKGYDPAVK